jgi:ATP-dependent DNA ligase
MPAKKKIPVVRRCIRPMLADDQKDKLYTKSKQYVLQEKYDGTRGMLYKVGDKVTGLISRYCDTDFTINFPEIVKDAKFIKAKQCVLDGEITFFDTNKNPFFLTAGAVPSTKKKFLVRYMVFDIIEYDGQRVTNLPLTMRLELLKKIIPPSLKHIKVIKTYTDPKKFPTIYKTIVKRKGVMLKKKDSKYIPGSRDEWVKVKKEQTEDCIVVGITHGLGRRKKTFGALILGQYDKTGRLVYVGNVGAGLSDAMLKEFLKTIHSMPEAPNPFGVKVNYVKKFIKPTNLIVEVKAMERTSYGRLRLPVFLRVRNDKEPQDCLC